MGHYTHTKHTICILGLQYKQYNTIHIEINMRVIDYWYTELKNV